MKEPKKNWIFIIKRMPFMFLIFCVDLMYVFPFLLPDFPIDLLIDIIIPILYFLSFVCLFFIKKEPYGDYSLIKMSLIGKVALIPWFGLNAFFALILFLGGIIIPINWFGLPVIFIMDLLMLVITSSYASFGTSSFYQRNQMPLKTLLIVLQWIFAVDVIGVIIVFIQCKRKDMVTSVRKIQ